MTLKNSEERKKEALSGRQNLCGVTPVKRDGKPTGTFTLQLQCSSDNTLPRSSFAHIGDRHALHDLNPTELWLTQNTGNIWGFISHPAETPAIPLARQESAASRL